MLGIADRGQVRISREIIFYKNSNLIHDHDTATSALWTDGRTDNLRSIAR